MDQTRLWMLQLPGKLVLPMWALKLNNSTNRVDSLETLGGVPLGGG